MSSKNYRPHIRILLRLCGGVATAVALALALTFFPSHAFAAISTPHAGPTFAVAAGFGARYQDKDGTWIPVQMTLRNDGPEFNGKISINPPAPLGVGNGSATSTYEQLINLPTGAQKQVTVYIPFSMGTPGVAQNVTVNLLDNNGQKINSQQATLRSLGPGDLFVGVLSNQTSGFGALGQIQLPSAGAQVVVDQLNATTMPGIVDALNNFDLIIIDNFDTASLNKEQIAALERWTAQGGTLIVVGGPEWRGTLAPLPASLVPVDITGTSTLPAGTHIFPIGGPGKGNSTQVSDGVPAKTTISTGTPKAGSAVLQGSGNTPLIVQANYDHGTLDYLAFDPLLDPLVTWPNASFLWKGLLIRGAGDGFLNTNQGMNSSGFIQSASSYTSANMAGLLQTLFPNAFPATWLILVLLLSYILILGPVRLLLVRFLKKRDWSWRIVLVTIVVFSLLSYGMALQQKGTSIISSTISVIQLSKPDQTGTSHASETTYLGIFVPSQGDFQVHIAGNDLVQPTSDIYSRYYQGPGTSTAAQHTTITATGNGTNVDLQGVDIWTLRSLESRHNTQVKGGISSQLALNSNTLTGSVTNTLPYGLDDAYVLVGNQYVQIGHLAAGQTVPVHLTLNVNQSGNIQSIADQIASSKGLNTPYGASFYSGQQPPQNDFQRHMAMLSTLSGESYNCGGGPCGGPAPVVITSGGTKRVFYNNSGSLLVGGRDPLSLPNVPATLIGFADNTPASNTPITINGNNLSGIQETFVKAPLDMTFSGFINLSPAFAPGQLIDTQGLGTEIQTVYDGVYLLGDAGMTFEYGLPAISNLQNSSLTVSEPTNFISNIGSNQGGNVTQGNINQLKVYVYNWKTGAWDSFSFNQGNLSINNAQPYIGPGGRVLVQVSNQDNKQGQTIITRPLLQFQGNAAS